MRVLSFLLVLTLLAGAAMAAEKAPKMADACKASAHQNLIGKTEAELAEVIFKTRSVRVLATNAPATMDFRPDRLNVLLDATGKVEQLTCG